MWLDLTWDVERRARWRTQRSEERLIALDVSVSGVRASAHTAPDRAVGGIVSLHLNELQSTAKIRRIEPTDDADVSIYGLQFVDASPEFVRALFLQAGHDPSDSAEAYWLRAT